MNTPKVVSAKKYKQTYRIKGGGSMSKSLNQNTPKADVYYMVTFDNGKSYEIRTDDKTDAIERATREATQEMRQNAQNMDNFIQNQDNQIKLGDEVEVLINWGVVGKGTKGKVVEMVINKDKPNLSEAKVYTGKNQSGQKLYFKAPLDVLKVVTPTPIIEDTDTDLFEQLLALRVKDAKLKPNELEYIEKVFKIVQDKTKVTRTQYESMAKKLGIDVFAAKELTELATVKFYHQIIEPYRKGSKSLQDTFFEVVEFYKNQPNISLRTSQSMILQQYSTAAPISFLVSAFVGGKGGNLFFEPSAGNGMLTIALDSEKVIVNEIDTQRNKNLYNYDQVVGTGFKDIWELDAVNDFGFPKMFDGAITNPPFGRLNEMVRVGQEGYKITTLEHLMAIRALDTIKDSGRAAIIIGGHTSYDKKGYITGRDWIFFNYLYRYYNVVDVININGELYYKQGTTINLRLILIDGRKAVPSGDSPRLQDTKQSAANTFEELFNIMQDIIFDDDSSLEGVYLPISDAKPLHTYVPDSMDYETHISLLKMREDVGDISAYVARKLGYEDKYELYQYLQAEQIDGVALAIYKIEKGRAIIIGDQTGIGKGRQAAAVVRYAAKNGYLPIFFTEKENLFSDIYRDLNDIGSADLEPFIVNTRGDGSHVRINGNIVYKSLPDAEKKVIFNSGVIPEKYDVILSTYSQLQVSPKGAGAIDKKTFFNRLVGAFRSGMGKPMIAILDESHNASGESVVGKFLTSFLQYINGALFLSATFAKSPKNMPIYASKTSISEAPLSSEELIETVEKGGVALQEILSSQLVKVGEMIRRERTYEGIEVNYIYLNKEAQAFGMRDLSAEHKFQYDTVVGMQLRLIQFQTIYVDKLLERKSGKSNRSEGELGISKAPAFNRAFQIVYQLLFSIKAKAVAERAIQRLKEGKKPVIAFNSTMGSFLSNLVDEEGLNYKVGDKVSQTYQTILKKALDNLLKYKITKPNGDSIDAYISFDELSDDGKEEYVRIVNDIDKLFSDVPISPIDVIVQHIRKAGYTVAEVTGRSMMLEYEDDNYINATLKARRKENVSEAFRRFNNNDIDVLLINQAGATGASAHAIVTPSVPYEQVKQRVMIILQPDLDINKEVQKRGRINRTGQVKKPIYDYVISDIPAEKRLMMMLQRKLKSLDANTSSNQNNSKALLSTPDFLNKYGDEVVERYVLENPDFGRSIDVLNEEGTKLQRDKDIANFVSGRVALLPTEGQEKFYTEVLEAYNLEVDYLKQAGLYDLEVQELNLEAETKKEEVILAASGGDTPFSGEVILEECEMNALSKPLTKEALDNTIKNYLSVTGKPDATFDDYTNFIVEKARDTLLNEALEKIAKVETKYSELIEELKEGKRYKKEINKMIDDAFSIGNTNFTEQDAKLAIENNLIEEREEEIEKIKIAENSKFGGYETVFKKLSIGKSINFFATPETANLGIPTAKAVVMGFEIKFDDKKPFTPSKVRLDLALANSDARIRIPFSKFEILSLNVTKNSYGSDDLGYLERWTDVVKNFSSNRITGYILTGNLLVAMAYFRDKYKGKLVSYTTKSGAIKKGLLVKEMDDNAVARSRRYIEIPILKALPAIEQMEVGEAYKSTTEVSIIKQSGFYKLNVPTSNKDLFTNEALLALVEDKNFKRIGQMMVGVVPDQNLRSVIILLNKFGMVLPIERELVTKLGISITQEKQDEQEDDDLFTQYLMEQLESLSFNTNVAGLGQVEEMSKKDTKNLIEALHSSLAEIKDTDERNNIINIIEGLKSTL